MNEKTAVGILYLNFRECFQLFHNTQTQEGWIRWANNEVDWELTEQQIPEGHNEWHRVQLEACS